MAQLFLNMIFAHIVGDFYCQTRKSINAKRSKGLKSRELYFHIIVILVFTWVSAWSWSFWWAALIIALLHLLIDAAKTVIENREENGLPMFKTRNALWPFVVDQVLHIIVLFIVVQWWIKYNNNWSQPSCIESLKVRYRLFALALLVSWKPANILVANILQYCQVNFFDKNHERMANFKLGALIGTLERWLIIFFMIKNQYEAIGILVAVKSIRDFGATHDSEKSEYVLAGTILSISIGVGAGMLMYLDQYVL